MLAVVDRAVQCQWRGGARRPYSFAQALGGDSPRLEQNFLDLDTHDAASRLARGNRGIAIGGLFLASKIASANQSAGTGDLLMNAIAAAVIGGTSLFGGRGRTWNALLGVLVIVSIQYGLQLESIAEPVKYMITAGVLLTTVVIDSITRKTQKTAGRA